MIEKLRDNPHEGFALADNEAKILCFELGIIDRFKSTDKLCTQAVIFGEHPTHYILALFFSGQPDPAENGFQVSCFPKSKVSPDRFGELVKEFDLGDTIYSEGFGGPPKNN